MHPEKKRDCSLISSLDDKVLIKIISNLSVKKATQTSLLSKRWRNLYHQINRVVIKDSEFVQDQWDLFKLDISTWVSRLPVEEIEVLEIHIVNPDESIAFLDFMVRFAVTRRIKNLVLDFSNPKWKRSDLEENHHFLFYLPDSVYHQTHIESLKLYSCGLNSDKFQNSTALKSFTVGWLHLCNVTTLLSKFPSLESLKFINCACLEDEEVLFGKSQNQLKELVVQDCDFADPVCRFDIPEVVRFKYSGTVTTFNFERVNKHLQEVYLDFGLETRYGIGSGQRVANLVHSLSSAKTLTVCSYLLQAIQHIEYEALHSRFETRHLVMKATMQSNEFIGISYMMNKSVDLESLTFEVVPERKIEMGLAPIEIEPTEFWFNKFTHKCLETTLKDVKVKAFGGKWYEISVLQYLIQHGLVLDRLTLYLDEPQRVNANTGASMLSQTTRASRRLWVNVI